ncbi:MAG: type IV pili methyl-accepting chemotaxis transducer N-terminal domain-containing protein, partial [Burkholderiaceae bacterium]|nr:type IV pili methyl-accepting chemotaxis transducer N-terminal domain-containing protein [Burkholderiaceae bacterium]
MLVAPLLSAWLAPASAQVRDINDAINKAGRQRMLSQRLAKAYV